MGNNNYNKESYPFSEKIVGDKKITVIEPVIDENSMVSIQEYSVMTGLYTQMFDACKGLLTAIESSSLSKEQIEYLYKYAGISEEFRNDVLHQ